MESSRGSPYQPLEQSQRHFRLLRLHESDTCQTQCEIKTFSLLDDDLPPWKALSYRWGEDAPEFTVHLNDYPVLVRKGLHTFLAQMIVENQHDWYFIDALCIDQSNDSEKSSQVQQMRQIYERAEEVVVWIVYEPYHIEPNIVDRNYVKYYVPESVYDFDEDLQDVSSLSQTKLEDAVTENSYWARLWILQEVLLARKLTIRVGNAEVEWSNLLPEHTSSDGGGLPTKHKNMMSLWGSGNGPYTYKQTAHRILAYRRFRTKALRAGYRLPFHKAVDFFSMQLCSRPHDVVFGYLGLTNSRIRIDYSAPILDLFIATLADYLLSEGFVRQELTRSQFRTLKSGVAQTIDLIPPLLAFGLDPYEPVVHLLMLEVTKLFVPGFEKNLTDTILITWWGGKRATGRGLDDFDVLDTDFKDIVARCVIRPVRLAMSNRKACRAAQKEIASRMKELESSDAVMPAPGESGESKTYSQWAEHARAISEQIWQRFLESGEDAEPETGLDDESWILNS